MITYGKILFCTTTYSRDRLLGTCWSSANSDFNRYIQKLRRLHENKIQYLRTIEAHSDGYPHFHAILRFPTVLTIHNRRYLRKDVYKVLKKSWSHGHSDYQPPRSKQSPLAYIIKYTTKESGHKIWKKYYQHLSVNSVEHPAIISGLIKKVGPSVGPVTALSSTCEKYKIKQCTWSRNFFNTYIPPIPHSLVSLDDDYT